MVGINTALCLLALWVCRFQAKPLNHMLAQVEESFRFYRRQSNDFARLALIRDHPELAHSPLGQQRSEGGPVPVHSEDLDGYREGQRRLRRGVDELTEIRDELMKKSEDQRFNVAAEARGAYEETLS
jgi:hypothetical protein